MIGFLKGEVLESGGGRWLIGIESGKSTIGYQVQSPGRADYEGYLPGSTVSLYVYTHVREDALDLFGFLTSAEKELFLSLISVNGIGPKVGLGILTAAEPALLLQAILEEDRAFLVKLHGVGKKTAERIALELGDALQKKIHAGLIPAPGTRSSSATISSKHRIGAKLAAPSALDEAVAGLVGLGFRELDAAAMLERASEALGPTALVEDLIRTALTQGRSS